MNIQTTRAPLSMTTGTSNIEEAFAQCKTLLDALLCVNSLGLPAGVIHVQTDVLNGWIFFKGKHIVKALVGETAQDGRGALQTLAGLTNARYRFEPEEPDAIEPESGLTPTSTTNINRKFVELSAEREHDETTLIFGGELIAMRPPSQSNSPAIDAMPMSDEEFRLGVHGRDLRAEFMQPTELMSGTETRFKEFVPPPGDSEDELSGSDDPCLSMLAKAGFTPDFQNVQAIRNQRHALRTQLAGRVDQPTAEDRPRIASISPLTGVAVVAASAGLLTILWMLFGGGVQGPAKTSQPSYSPGSAISAAPAPEHATVAPPSQSTAASTNAGSTTGAHTVDGGIDDLEAQLANAPTNVQLLKELVKRYMSKGNLRRARQLSGAACRLHNLSTADQRFFHDAYEKCAAQK